MYLLRGRKSPDRAKCPGYAHSASCPATTKWQQVEVQKCNIQCSEMKCRRVRMHGVAVENNAAMWSPVQSSAYIMVNSLDRATLWEPG